MKLIERNGKLGMKLKTKLVVKTFLIAVLFLGQCVAALAMDNIEADVAYDREIKDRIRTEFIQGLKMLKAQAEALHVDVRQKDIEALQKHMYEKSILIARCFDKGFSLIKNGVAKTTSTKYVDECITTHTKFMASFDREDICKLEGTKVGAGSKNEQSSVNAPYDFLKLDTGVMPPWVLDYVAIKDCYDKRARTKRNFGRD
ncbi:hypothetical protein JQ609_01030 [Bradyrhizobium sp. AUGA SZCCT0169]|uniref:hypothetical protein n=1 Tax=Bradyrhizobium sp. AUGA SZCCT0169 TaxID=2807663 RepID=UPI001BA827CB|nr:hypothetical protein [Bradyrhizobium sp. AUGA SZCCT0169]MBR1245506.1 hypothetical protein [Bradyrhizobium sp. AUGA SZCCT0169]